MTVALDKKSSAPGHSAACIGTSFGQKIEAVEAIPGVASSGAVPQRCQASRTITLAKTGVV
jgi:hypothetical protein